MSVPERVLGVGGASWLKVSGDGRFVAFVSRSGLLVADDTNQTNDVFVLDTRTGAIDRASLNNDGSERTGWWAGEPAISRDGRFVTYLWQDGYADAGDVTRSDVYLRDRLNKTTVLINRSRTGGLSNGECEGPSISADGGRVAFNSQATNLVKGDTHADSADGVYVRFVAEGKTLRVDVDSEGEPAQGDATGEISANGRSVVFSSDATNLVAHDTNGRADVFLRDLEAGTTARVSVSSSGDQANGDSWAGCASSDGKRVAFGTDATNLIPGDVNGVSDVVLRDVTASMTVPVSVGASGTTAAAPGADPLFDGIFDLAISGNGRYVLFSSNSAPLVGNRRYAGTDEQRPFDVYLRDTLTRQTLLVSDFGSIPTTLAVSSSSPSISDDGGLIAFTSNVEAERQTGVGRWADAYLRRLTPAK